MVSAKDLVRISDFKHYYFLISDKEVKIGDEICCVAGGLYQPMFVISDKKIGENYDLGYGSLVATKTAKNIAYFVDKCKLRITYLEHEDDTLYIHVTKKL